MLTYYEYLSTKKGNIIYDDIMLGMESKIIISESKELLIQHGDDNKHYLRTIRGRCGSGRGGRRGGKRGERSGRRKGEGVRMILQIAKIHR